jgi:hypothetical protein
VNLKLKPMPVVGPSVQFEAGQRCRLCPGISDSRLARLSRERRRLRVVRPRSVPRPANTGCPGLPIGRLEIVGQHLVRQFSQLGAPRTAGSGPSGFRCHSPVSWGRRSEGLQASAVTAQSDAPDPSRQMPHCNKWTAFGGLSCSQPASDASSIVRSAGLARFSVAHPPTYWRKSWSAAKR